MVQKRCYRGEFRLRPDRFVKELIEFALGHYAQVHGIELHDFTVMFNHDHLLLTDPLGNRPQFLQDFHSYVARGINAYFGDKESVFSSQRYSGQLLPTPHDKLRKMGYLLANPVAARICRDPRDYHGVSSFNMEYDQPRTIQRPDFFVGEDKPKTVQLVIRRPPGLRPDLSNFALRRLVRQQALEESKKHVAEVKASGQRFLGFDKAMKTPRTRSTQASRGPGGRAAHIRPHVSAADQELRAKILNFFKSFFQSHRDRMRTWREGDRTSPFPAGTYKMRVTHGMPVLSAELPWDAVGPP